jgi:hypothetical protein
VVGPDGDECLGGRRQAEVAPRARGRRGWGDALIGLTRKGELGGAHHEWTVAVTSWWIPT